jgi:lysophospholipase L1-like esterase
MGDSITAGISSEPIGPGYAELLVPLLAGTHDVVNTAVPGSSTYYWLPSTPCASCTGGSLFAERVSPELPADIVTILLGTNDAIGTFLPARIPVDEYERSMREIIDSVFLEGAAAVVLMSPPPIYSPRSPPIVDELLTGYRASIRAICGDTEAVLCGPDVYTLLEPSDFSPEDWVHPNRFGHEKIALALRDTLISMPEPGTGTLVLFGLALLARCGRRNSE